MRGFKWASERSGLTEQGRETGGYPSMDTASRSGPHRCALLLLHPVWASGGSPVWRESVASFRRSTEWESPEEHGAHFPARSWVQLHHGLSRQPPLRVTLALFQVLVTTSCLQVQRGKAFPLLEATGWLTILNLHIVLLIVLFLDSSQYPIWVDRPSISWLIKCSSYANKSCMARHGIPNMVLSEEASFVAFLV